MCSEVRRCRRRSAPTLIWGCPQVSPSARAFRPARRSAQPVEEPVRLSQVAVAAPTPTPWAPAGPVPGSQASALASAINGARAGAPASGVNAGGVAGAGAFAATEIGRRAPSPSGAASGGTGAQGGPGAGPLPVKGFAPAGGAALWAGARRAGDDAGARRGCPRFGRERAATSVGGCGHERSGSDAGLSGASRGTRTSRRTRVFLRVLTVPICEGSEA